MNKKAFIFDLDGVLVHTDRFHYLAWKTVAGALDIYFDEEINNRLRGISREASLEIVLERYTGAPLSTAEKAALCERANTICLRHLSAMTPEDVSEDVRETLRTLRARGYRLAVGSSSRNAKLVLGRTGLAEMFDAVSDGTNISRAKPDPEVFCKAAEFLGLAAADCAVVEDAAAGIDAAKAGGFTAIGIGDAARYGKTDHAIRALSDLLPLAPPLK